MRHLLLLTAICPLLTACGSSYSGCCAGEDPELLMEEMRAEIASVRYHQEDAQAEIDLLEERMEEQQLLSQTNLEVLHAQFTSLQRKISELEGQQQAALSDIRDLGTYAKESATALNEVQAHQKDYLADLKGAVESLSAIATEEYKVVSGDTLEKIARKFDSTIGAIKEENDLKSDRIYAGQTLRIP